MGQDQVPELRLADSIVDDRYEVERCLSHGSYAEIFIARDLAQDGLLIIIKALNAFLQGTPDADLERTLIQNFQNEAIALDKVCHPNIIRRLGHGTAADLEQTPFHYLVLEYMPGGDLLSLCRNHPLSLTQTIAYFEQISAALSFAHSRQVIHRDVKPNNLLLSGDRKVVKIADFGVARIAASDSDEITRVGTNLYAPPEHHPDSQTAALRQSLTPSADVYSMAKTIFTAMTGRSPHQYIREPISSIPEELSRQPWGSRLLAILKKATSTEVESRYHSVKEFWDDFAELDPGLESTRVTEPDPDPEDTLVRSRINGRAATIEGASIPAGSLPPGEQSDLECAPHSEISQPEFQPHIVAAAVGDQRRPQKARIVIELPARAQPTEKLPGGLIENRPEAPGQEVLRPALIEGRAAAGPDNLNRDEAAGPAAAGVVGTGQQAAVKTWEKTAQTEAVTSSAGPIEVRVQATKPMASAPKPAVLDRVRRNTQWLTWIRRMFTICMILALVGLIASVYLYFARPDHSVPPLSELLGASYKDGSITGAPNVNIRSEPDGDSLAALPAGTRVRVLEERSNWARVKILRWEGAPPDGAPDTGWVHHRFIKMD
jgi:serine/threonine protein kinase